MNRPELSTGLSADQVRFIERCVKGFRQALDRGERPVPDRYLEQTPHEFLKRELLKALLRADWDSQQAKGRRPAVDPYVTQYAHYSESVSDAYQQWTHEHNDMYATTPPVTPAAAPTVSRTPPVTPAAGPTVSRAPPPPGAPPPGVTCHYLRHGVPVGPFTWDQLAKMARAGDLRPRDQVHLGGTAGWQEAGQVSGLFAPSTKAKNTELNPGEVIQPDYMLLELIGRGGMGDVYKVFRISLKREYALKIIRQDRFQLLSPEMKEDQVGRFQKEMQTTARLKHEHIVVIHDTGEHCGLPFYTMDFVETNLANKLRQGPIPARQAAEIMAKAARGVHHANIEGIIHRDIKPHNILLDKDKPLVADLGLAAALEVLQKGQGEIAGTAAYMAPEQACGGFVDARTDVYGLGATLYHLVTGRPPHQASDRNQVLKQVTSGETLPPRRLNPTIDRSLNAVIMKCLEKKPDRRYGTALELAEDLERYLKGYPVKAKAPSVFERVGKWMRREPIKAMLAAGVAGLFGLLVLVLAVFVLVQFISNIRLSNALAEAKEAKENAEKKEAEAKTEKDAADESRKTAEEQRNTAREERDKASTLAFILDRRALNKQRFDDDPRKIVERLEKQTAEEERLLKEVRDPKTARQIQVELADNYRVLADAIMNTTDPKTGVLKVIELLKRCVEIQEELGKWRSSFKVDLGLNYIELAGWYSAAHEPVKVLEMDEKALKVLEEARKEGFNEPPILARIAEAYMMLGLDNVNLGHQEIALKDQKEAVRILEQLLAAPSLESNHVYQQKLGRACQMLGSNDGIESHAEAITYLEKAEKILRDKAQYRRNLADVYLSLGQRQTKNDQPDRGLQSLQSAYNLTEDLIKEKPASKLLANSLQILRATIQTAQAAAFEKKGDLEQAVDYHKRSLETRKSTGDDRDYVDGLSALAKFYGDQKRYVDAIPILDEAIPLQEKLVAESPKKDFNVRQMAGVLHYNKALYLFEVKKYPEALAACERAKAFEIEAFRLKRGSPVAARNLFMTFQVMEYALKNQNRPEDAIKVIIERNRLFLEQAKSLAKIYETEEGKTRFPEILAFFHYSLSHKERLLRAEDIQNDPDFAELRKQPEFEKLLK